MKIKGLGEEKQEENESANNFSWKFMPVELLYSEEFSHVADAFKREKQIQKWSRKKKEALMNGDIEKLKTLSKNHTEYRKGELRKPKANKSFGP
ncbi:MAG: GIY-YIG nuclease family protein [Saprospiraceae bacterium]